VLFRSREATILRMRFGLYDGEQKTLSEVGRKLRITRERVRQIESTALERLAMRRELEALNEAAA